METKVPPKVLVVSPVGGTGGMDFYNHSFCKSLSNVGLRPILLTSSSKISIGKEYVLWEYYKCAFGSQSKIVRAASFIGATFYAFVKARLNGVRILHYHIFKVCVIEFFALSLARVLRFKIFLTVHDVEPLRGSENKLMARNAYHSVSGFVVHSVRALSSLVSIYNIDRRRIWHIRHGDYLEMFQKKPSLEISRKVLKCNIDEFVVLFFGQIKKVKRLDLLIEAVALIKLKQNIKIRLLIAGKNADEDLDKVTSRIIENGLSDHISAEFEYISNDEVAKYFAASNMAVLPYDNIYQSGVVVLAMSFGLPVLVSDIPGMSEIVQHGFNGIQFAAGNAVDLAEKIVQAKNGKWDLARLSANALNYVREKHSWRDGAEALKRIYAID